MAVRQFETYFNVLLSLEHVGHDIPELVQVGQYAPMGVQVLLRGTLGSQ